MFSSKNVAVFASMTGDYPNIGDAVIRRLALDWVPDRNRCEIYVGRSPEVWASQIGAVGKGTVYRGRMGGAKWLMKLVLSKSPVLLYEPGEVALPRKAVLREGFFALLNLLVRCKRGVVVYTPRSIVRADRFALFVYRMQVSLGNYAFWREPTTSQLGLKGKPSPDIAFSLRAFRTGGDSGIDADDARKLLVVSMRGKRSLPSHDWFRAVQNTAERHGLEIVATSQVQEDAERAQELANRLGGSVVPWSSDVEAHEKSLLDIYGRARLVVSDRLHVLAIAGVNGASVAELAPQPSGKVANHFAQVGLHNVSTDSSVASVSDQSDFLSSRIRSRLEQAEIFAEAKRKTEESFAPVIRMLEGHAK
ncbi:polysaccharide pyruvyl transferase family protein [Rhodococcus pyridinivorans]|uniref:polysaccharide pyruvyl transferase family protein n=1 Tax=Rhodococcus pyridinivorans TaxID=103816 RepID=UPI000B304C2F|nr:polysaccharide pyruvyl transferase family protein [Rhodococcus pyridinivorans]